MAQKSEQVRYIEAIGRRKTAVARTRIIVKNGDKNDIIVNDMPFTKYFSLLRHQKAVMSPFDLLGEKGIDASIHVKGGGISMQSEAVRLGLARALLSLRSDDDTVRKRLRGAGFLTRDPREVERKKPGLKKARRAPQWAKR